MTDALKDYANGGGIGISASPFRNAATTTLSAAISLVVHGAVFAAAILWIDDRPGAIDVPTEAISVELFQTEVVESTEVIQTEHAAASPASAELDAGIQTAQRVVAPLEEIKEIDATEAKLAKPANSEEELEVLRGQSMDAVPPHWTVEKTSREPIETKRKRASKTARLYEIVDTKSKATASEKRGGPRSRAANGSASSSGRVSASNGSARNYAAVVRARVAGRRPSGRGRRGTVVVSFGVTGSGGLSYSSIARSSGDPGLDSSVLSAVRGAAPFPRPPPGARLRFAMPFYFR